MNIIYESILNFIGLINFRDILDLILVWALLYRLMLFTRTAGAYQILTGIGFLALAYWLSIWAELITFNWLLESFFSHLFIIVVILFQSEIRRALAQVGGNPFFVSKTRLFEESYVVEEISKGLFLLAQRGIGALVVIENEVELDYFVEKGLEVDSKITAELITSIFLPESPLHDGAIVIRGTRISAAGCFLPLSKNPVLDKNLGTRHRAAIGLSDETDAVVFVVSEESKSVGEAKSGKFISDLEVSEVRKKISSAYGVKYKGIDKGKKK